MDYNNRERVFSILNEVSKLEGTIQKASIIKTGVELEGVISVTLSEIHGTYNLPLTEKHIINLMETVISECEAKIDKYKTELSKL